MSRAEKVERRMLGAHVYGALQRLKAKLAKVKARIAKLREP